MDEDLIKPPLNSNVIFSIITVVRNDEERLAKTINSLEAIYNDERFEHIIVDCLSTDGTAGLLKKVSCNINCIVISGPDAGIYDAMNKGANLAAGIFVLFLNCGDELLATPHELVCLCYEINHLLIDIACFPSVLQYTNWKMLLTPRGHTKYKMPTSHQAMIFSREFLYKHPYNIKYRIAGDFDLYLSATTKRILIHSSGGPLTLIQGEGFASANPSLAYKEYLNIIINRRKGLALIKSFIVIFCKGVSIATIKNILPTGLVNYLRSIGK